MGKLKAVILAAGKGTRMNSDLPKVIHKCMGQPMVHYAIKAAKDAGAYDVCVIVGYKAKEVRFFGAVYSSNGTSLAIEAHLSIAIFYW